MGDDLSNQGDIGVVEDHVLAALEGEFERLERQISDDEKETNPDIEPRLERIKQLIEERLNQ